MLPPLRILVLARSAVPHVKLAWETLAPAFEKRKGIEIVQVVTEDTPPPDLPPIDIAMVIGGDGAILRASHHFGKQQVPVLGINLGRLGFLADLSPEELIYNLDQLEHRQFQISHHMMFECTHRRADGRQAKYLGLNEATLSSAAALSMLDVEFGLEGEWATTYSGDGVIISTPTGSTAHNLSAGGPLLEQDLRAFVITPICPHTLTNRPLVVSADREYMFTLPRAPEGAMLVIDGQIKEPILPGDQISVRKANVTFPMVRVPGYSYYATLRRKLGWGGQPRYQRAP